MGYYFSDFWFVYNVLILIEKDVVVIVGGKGWLMVEWGVGILIVLVLVL